MFCWGSKILLTAKLAAVFGRSCIRPKADLGETARELKFDSTEMMLATSIGSTPFWDAAARICSP